MFTLIEPGYAVLQFKGVFSQVKIYEYKGRIYAAHGKGFISLSNGGGTSVPHVRHAEVTAPDIVIKRNTLGYLVNPATFEGDTVAL